MLNLTPLSLLKIASLHQKHPLATVAISVSLLLFMNYFGNSFPVFNNVLLFYNGYKNILLLFYDPRGSIIMIVTVR
jgi:hypothetical protein